jgi:hypothetical protein
LEKVEKQKIDFTLPLLKKCICKTSITMDFMGASCGTSFVHRCHARLYCNTFISVAVYPDVARGSGICTNC